MVNPKDQARSSESPPEVLQQLAVSQPELQVEIAQNPSAYPALLEWIKEWGTPEGANAAAARLSQAVTADRSSLLEVDDDTAFAETRDRTVRAEASLAAAPAPTQVSATVEPHPTQIGRAVPDPRETLGPAPLPASHQPQRLSPTGAPPPPPEQPKRIPIWAWILGAVLLALVAGALVWFFLLASDSDAESADVVEVVETEEVEAEEVEAEDVEEVEEEEVAPAEPEIDYSLEPVAPEILFPSPPGAVSASWFVDGSYNIACELASRSATCTVYEHDFTPDGPGCGSGPATIVMDEDGIHWDCTLTPIERTDDGQAPILTPSTSAATGTGACLATYGAMTCWNTLNGDSFAISQFGWLEGTDGVIPENTFPWVDQIERR